MKKMPETNARKDRLMALPGFIVLITKPNDPALYGPIENSFSLDVVPNRTKFYWTSDNATSNFGGTFKVDGRRAHAKSDGDSCLG